MSGGFSFGEMREMTVHTSIRPLRRGAAGSARSVALARAGEPLRRTPPPPERRGEILRVAADVIWERGFDDARMRDISDELGLVKGALYHYVPSKERLLYEIIKEAFDESAATMRSILGSDAWPLDMLAGLIAAHIELEHEHQVAHLVRVRDFRLLPKYLQDELLAIRDECEDIFVAVLERGRGAGLVTLDLDLRVQALSLLHWLQALTDWRTQAPEVSVRFMALTQAASVVTAVATDKAIAHSGGIEGLRARITSGHTP